MNEYAILAFVVMPIVTVLIGVVAVVLHGREANRLERQRDGADGTEMTRRTRIR